MKFEITLKKSFSILFGFQLGLIILSGVLIFTLFRNQINLAQSRDTSFNSYLLADELRQSSNDLTRLARSYVATGNPEFEREYWAVLDIRNGKIPRPIEYNRIYWDFVSATGEKPRPDGEAQSLNKLMLQEGFTDAELEKLTLAEKNSNDLVVIERVAMNAVKGLFDDGTGNFTIKKDPDFEMANSIMNGEDYYKIKAEIMKPIDEFYVMFEERTGANVAKYLERSTILFWSTLSVIIFTTILALYSFIIIKRQIKKREEYEQQISELNKNIEKKVNEKTEILKKQEASLKEDIKILKQKEAKLKESYKQTERANELMVNRELKMIELKKEISDIKKKEKK
ncbi:MAG: hypothetical protein V1848_01325 [Candidatus Magasanikbacteria bacterium]